MLKGVFFGRTGYTVLLGLSKENIKRMQEDNSPIACEVTWCREPIPIVIFAGETEETIQKHVEAAGVPLVKQRELPHISRTQAEFLVDLIEGYGAHLDIATELRQVWGMSPRA